MVPSDSAATLQPLSDLPLQLTVVPDTLRPPLPDRVLFLGVLPGPSSQHLVLCQLQKAPVTPPQCAPPLYCSIQLGPQTCLQTDSCGPLTLGASDTQFIVGHLDTHLFLYLLSQGMTSPLLKSEKSVHHPQLLPPSLTLLQ